MRCLGACLIVSYQIDLDECHLSKSLADFGGHYMRPDLIRLLVDDRRKNLIVTESENGGVHCPSTLERVGLAKPLSSSRPLPKEE